MYKNPIVIEHTDFCMTNCLIWILDCNTNMVLGYSAPSRSKVCEPPCISVLVVR